MVGFKVKVRRNTVWGLDRFGNGGRSGGGGELKYFSRMNDWIGELKILRLEKSKIVWNLDIKEM